jgi:uncharacterized protein
MNRTILAALLFAGVVIAAQQTINVDGVAEVKVPPDHAIISLGVEVHAKTMSDARHDNDRRVRAVLATAKRSGIQEKDIQTDFIQLGINYQIDGLTPQYFYARKSILLVVRDIGHMEQVLSAALDAGATHIHGVEFATTKLREYRDQARAMAVKAAMEKARDMAAAAGLKVVGGPMGISSANYGGRSWYGSGWWGYSTGYANAIQNSSDARPRSDSNGDGTMALGRISVTASVAMSFRIE